MKRTDSNHSHQRCVAFFERLSEYIDRELDAPTRNDIEGHIKACTPCRICLNTLQQTVDLCRNLKRRQVPKTFSLTLKSAISDLIGTPSD